MKSVNVKCLICIAVLALVVVNHAESHFAPDLVSLSVGGELVIVGKLLTAEGKMDAQTQVLYTDVTVEVVQVIRNTTEREITVSSTVNFRPFGGQIGNHWEGIIGGAEFSKEEIGDLLLLSLRRPYPRGTPWARKGFDTIFDVFGGESGKHTVKIKDDVSMVYLSGMKHWVVDPQFPRGHKDHYRGLEIGLPLDWVLEVMNMAITLASQSPVQKPKTREDIPAEVKVKFRRLKSVEKSIRKLAGDGVPEAVIIGIAREDLARVKAELDLQEGGE